VPSAIRTYGFLSAKLKARISKTMPPETMDRLIKARSLPEAVQFLRGTAYQAIEEAYTATGDLRAGEALLHERELRLYTGLFRYLDEPVLSFVRALAARYEIDQVKNAVRLWFDAHVRGRDVAGKSGYLFRGTIVNRMDVDAIVRAADVEGVAAALSGTPYAAIARAELPAAQASRSVFSFELALDRRYYDEAFAAAASLGGRDREAAERALGVDVDLQNVSWLIRFKDFYGMGAEDAMSRLIPRGRAIKPAAVAAVWDSERGSRGAGGIGLDLLGRSYPGVGAMMGGGGSAAKLAVLEAAIRRVADDEAGKSLCGYPFSIGVVLAYFTKKRAEMRAVMTVLNAKYYALAEERIRSSL